jgi:hypothetical protein
MRTGRVLGLMALGAGAVLAYQKYNKPVMKKLQKTFNTTAKNVDNTLGNMM